MNHGNDNHSNDNHSNDERRPAAGAEPRLGVDIGRVIIAGPANPHGGDTAFFNGNEAALLATPEVPGAVDAVARLVTAFAGQVWLVSKCGPRVQARTLRWLAGHDFLARTGLPAGHVRFCRTRPEKRIHCEDLCLTHFVDDRPDVHAAIAGAVAHQYLFGPQTRGVPGHVRHTPTWVEAERLILATLQAPAVAHSRHADGHLRAR
jgi:tRNA(Leu) C34 or U34 (ribose-2'-O)-methylase TrmL